MADTNLVGELENQVNGLLPMYEAAAKMYSYENLSGSRQLNDDSDRKQKVHFMTHGLGSPNLLGGCAAWGLVSVLLMSRARAKNIFDIVPIIQDPFRTFGWFLIGANVAAYRKYQVAAENVNGPQHALLLHRVAANQ